jgi:uncharacterized protein (TIGR03067 family)
MAVAILATLVLWPGDRDRLQGTWTGDDVRLTFDGDVTVLERLGGPDQPAPLPTYYRLDPSARPKRIVVWAGDGPDDRRRFLGMSFGPRPPGRPDLELRGIYELNGDRLRICLPPPGGDFPIGFDQGGIVLEVRRE